jgi:P27 family predicted phage terminase small subunit
MTRHPPAPDHLSKSTQQWWKAVLDAYDLQDHHVRILQLACEAFDRAQEARQTLEFEGLVMPSRQGSKVNPLVRVANDCTVIFVRCVRELGLDVEPPDSRPPALTRR